MIDAGALLFVLLAQQFEQRGFIENRAVVYPQTAPNDSGHLVDELLLREEASYKFAPWLTVSGAFDARTDSHRQTAREWVLDADDRSIQRPPFSVRRLSATIHRGKVTAVIGRQLVRWGKTDILNPTDRFAPKDYLSSVVDADVLGVSAARFTYESGGDTIDLVWQPWFTPSRTPLLNQRWTALPAEAAGVSLKDAGARYPGGSQYGARWNHIGSGYEYSLCFFDGYQNLPSFDAVFSPLPEAVAPLINVSRTYPKLRLYGGDAAVPLRWLTVKGEAAYFTSSTPGAEEYALYVIQLERQVKEWSFVGGYAGSVVTRDAASPLQFAPDRGFAKSFVGRAGLTIDANRSLAIETAVRAGGSFVRFEYSQLFGQHWRATGGIAWIRGDMGDFIGQYRRNSYGSLAIRYSF
ncbi:MAG: hypothetical protein JWO19_2473 [Bryobacterales bacterium]|jgi:hypothetical protein|nr:hypothetical protein [Bryobacterales bacterium]